MPGDNFYSGSGYHPYYHPYPYVQQYHDWQYPSQAQHAYYPGFSVDSNFPASGHRSYHTHHQHQSYQQHQYQRPPRRRYDNHSNAYNRGDQYQYMGPDHQDRREYGQHDRISEESPLTLPKSGSSSSSLPRPLSRPANLPYRKHDDRPVTPPPRRDPTPAYIAEASQNPYPLDHDAAWNRKLLVLDLNGTLLHRGMGGAARNKHKPHSTAPSDSHDAPAEPAPRPLPRLRSVHPRPYMAAFRSYLFAPETKAWLDVMIWSSAQPHSVNDMVSQAFKEDQEQLVAIWARDTLGLSNDHYARKVQTFKDLEKPWAELPSLLGSRNKRSSTPASERSSRPSSPQMSPPPSSAPSLPSSPPRHVSDSQDGTHSALTTLLLDDSPRKAELQPYNHVCIPEYDGARRGKDLEILQNEKLVLQSIADRAASDSAGVAQNTEEIPDTEDAVAETLEDDPSPDEQGKKRKRKDKKAKKAAAMVATLAESSARGDDPYDQTLLAVVGILDEVKVQGNVAAWIRTGGLWGHPQEAVLTNQDTPASQEVSNTNTSGTEDSERDTKRTKGADESLSLRAEPTGNDAISTTAGLPASSDPAATVDGEATSHSVDAPASTPMWFEDPATVRYWVSRGRKVLEEMGIPILHGIER
ncbi:hypothetical protein EIP91_000173 [Steccherinum ochraceum]|uniref:FCP1 homology domain-containing protein n=1 Tax=Steccherinum ochraceum TaxID=92696 RepID=A0A4R0RQN4_9APHY|nr:hypothetical protein EIP91_000173 [Steccherinum ochraceum]